jgi:hypothetical protein
MQHIEDAKHIASSLGVDQKSLIDCLAYSADFTPWKPMQSARQVGNPVEISCSIAQRIIADKAVSLAIAFARNNRNLIRRS